MADFDLTQTDAQVQSILNDAQGAMGAGAQTSLTTDYIMLKDTSGNYHKILKDSFTEACRNVLAGLLVNNDKGTTISQIAAIASGDFGSVTPANLASVLGVTTNSIASDQDLNDIKTAGKYYVVGTPTNMPFSGLHRGILIVESFTYNGSSYYSQTYREIVNNACKLYTRTCDGTWGNWREVAFDS